MSTEVQDYILPTHLPSTGKLAEIAAKIAYGNFEWRYITLVFFNSTLLYGVTEFLQLYDKSVVVSRGKHVPLHAEQTTQYIIFGTNVDNIRNMLDWMQKYQFDNTGRYVIICQSRRPKDCNENEAVETFWYHKITNVIFLKHSGNVTGYTYFYNEENCAMTLAYEMTDLDNCLSNISGKPCVLFPEKFHNLRRCDLIASTFEQPPYMSLKRGKPKGCDGDLLLIIADALNATLKIITPHRGDGWGALGKDGKWIGSLADIYYDLANISMTSAALTLHRFSAFQLSFNYNFVIIGWLTSPTELQPSSLKLLHPFQISTHIGVGMIFVLVLVVALIVRSNLLYKLKERLELAKENSLVFYSWMIFMGLPAQKLPKQSFLLNITFIWIWYTFLIRTMYQASLINSLKSNHYTTNVDTIEQVIEANYKFGGGTALRDYYINYPLVYENFIPMNAGVVLETTKRISQGEKSAVCVNLESVNTFLKNNGGHLHVLSQRIVVSPTAVFFKKFSPLADPINLILQRLTEAGIPDKLYRKYVRARTKMPKTADNTPMTMEHYTGCYAVLFSGWIISFLVFICELCFGFKD